MPRVSAAPRRHCGPVVVRTVRAAWHGFVGGGDADGGVGRVGDGDGDSGHGLGEGPDGGLRDLPEPVRQARVVGPGVHTGRVRAAVGVVAARDHVVAQRRQQRRRRRLRAAPRHPICGWWVATQQSQSQLRRAAGYPPTQKGGWVWEGWNRLRVEGR